VVSSEKITDAMQRHFVAPGFVGPAESACSIAGIMAGCMIDMLFLD
jgi:hypothetical protein